jgi:hypothetical protein
MLTGGGGGKAEGGQRTNGRPNRLRRAVAVCLRMELEAIYKAWVIEK